jgi:hypothetical protein
VGAAADRLAPSLAVEGWLYSGHADFDLESFRQVSDNSFWYGDEFGPYLLHTDVTGKMIDSGCEWSW